MESAERHAPVAQAIPRFPHPLRTDPKPRAVWPAGLQHLTLPDAPRDALQWAVDGYLDGRKSGQTHCITEWARRTGIKKSTLEARFKRGWDAQHALTVPTKGTR